MYGWTEQSFLLLVLPRDLVVPRGAQALSTVVWRSLRMAIPAIVCLFKSRSFSSASVHFSISLFAKLCEKAGGGQNLCTLDIREQLCG
jgi:hypothetical protein